VAQTLIPGELALWRQMSRPDRRHAVGVARRVQAALGDQAEPPVLAAALLHDVGKVASGLGTFGRVAATVAGVARSAAREGDGRVARYLRHDVLGAEMLAKAGSDPLTVAWAREHHLTYDRWSVPRPVGGILKFADDD
jgi:putative nucleotidyltransferase with HDIG domain